MPRETPVDLSDVRTRPTSERRSRARISAPRPATVRSQDFQREISAGIPGAALGKGLQQLGNTLSSFFEARGDAADLAEHRKKLNEIDQENAQFAIDATNTVLSRPKAFKKALETGDWSAFPDVTPDQRSRSAFIDTGRKLLGQNEAREMAGSPEFLEALNNSSNPDEARREYLREQTDGADPLYAAALQGEFYNRTDQAVAQRKAAIQLNAAETVRDRAMVTMVDNLESIHGPEDLSTHIGAIRRSMAVMGPRAMLEAEDSAYKELLRKAFVEGDLQALKLVKMKDPGFHDGLSVEERFPDETRQFAAEGVNSFGRTETRDQAEAIAGIRNMAAEGDIGGAMEALRDFEEEHAGSYNDEIISIKGQLIKALGSEVNLTDALNEALAGRNNLDVSESRKIDTQVFRRLFPEALSRGMDPRETSAAVSSWLRMTHPSTDLKGAMGAILRGSNPDARAQLLQIVRGIPEAQRGGKFMENDQDLANYLLEVAESGQDPEAAYQLTLEHGMPDATRAQVLSRNFGWAPKEEAKQLNDAVTDALNYGGDQGLYDTPFFGVDEEDIDPRLKQFSDNVYRDLARQFPSLPQDRIASMHKKKIAARAATILVNGEYRWTLTDDIQFMPSGGRWKAPDQGYLDDARDFFASNEAGLRAATHVPRTGAARSPRAPAPLSTGGSSLAAPEMELTDLLIDEDSYNNYGLLPQFETPSGTVAPFGASVGDVVWVHPSQRDSDLYRDFPEIERFEDGGPQAPEGMGSFVPLRVTGGDRLVGDRMMWRYNPETDSVVLRYIGIDRSAPAEAARLDKAHVSGTGPGGLSDADRSARNARRSSLFQQRQRDLAAPGTQSAEDITKQSPASSPEEVMANIEAATNRDRTSGTFILDYGSPEGQDFYRNVYTPFLTKQEGVRYFAYDDATGRRVRAGVPTKGDRTIGIGFNLDKYPNAKGVLTQVGLEPKQIEALYQGDYQLSNQQVQDINAVVSTKAARALWERYKDVAGEMTQKQWAALLSLHHHGVTQTPKMTAAIKEGDWETAADEVLFKSEAGIQESQLAAVRARRIREATWLLGGRAVQHPFIEKLRQAKSRLYKTTAIRGVQPLPQ